MASNMKSEKAQSVPMDRLVRERVAALSYLPTTTAVAMKFMELGRNPDADPAEYAAVISADVALSTKILGLSNSAWFGVRNRVTKPQVAVNLLGLGTIRTLTISWCLTGLHNDLALSPEESRMFWSASLCKAVAAKQYAAHFDPELGEEAFTCGIFQDFAVPVMYSLAKQPVLGLLRDASIDAEARLERERAIFQLDHAEIARLIAEKLELPELFIDAVAFHHNRKSLHEFLPERALADATYVASLFPQELGAWNRSDAEKLSAFLAETTQIPLQAPLEAARYLESVQKEYDQLCAYFERGLQGNGTSLAELLAEATREAADSTTRLVASVQQMMTDVATAGMAAQQLMQENDTLAEKAKTDSLTQTRNREGFFGAARDLIARVQRYGIGFALAYLDIDEFKQLNDAAGHAHGDKALQHVARTMLDNVRKNDLVARIGGDEFVILFNEITRDDTEQILNRIITAARPPAPERPENAPPPPTLSAGLLFVPPKSAPLPLETLMSLADALMYQSKRAGGNRLTQGTPETAPNVRSA